MQQYPHMQPFNKNKAKEASQERFQNGVHIPPNLKRRQKDWEGISDKNKMAYHKPGSNKK